MDNPQDAVLEDYKSTKAFRNNPRAEEYLHLFFSPNRIPVGLVDNEVARVIRLYPYRKRMIERFNEIEDAKLAKYFETNGIPPIPPPTFQDALELFEKEKDYYENIENAVNHLEHVWKMAEMFRNHPLRLLMLPEELSPSVLMTRKRFRNGIRKFIAEYRKICE